MFGGCGFLLSLPLFYLIFCELSDFVTDLLSI